MLDSNKEKSVKIRTFYTPPPKNVQGIMLYPPFKKL